jgi:hypothetical protein
MGSGQNEFGEKAVSSNSDDATAQEMRTDVAEPEMLAEPMSLPSRCFQRGEHSW